MMDEEIKPQIIIDDSDKDLFKYFKWLADHNIEVLSENQLLIIRNMLYKKKRNFRHSMYESYNQVTGEHKLKIFITFPKWSKRHIISSFFKYMIYKLSFNKIDLDN